MRTPLCAFSFASILLLNACGGGGGGDDGGGDTKTFSVGGEVQGLTGTLGLTLTTSADQEDSITLDSNGQFTFGRKWASATTYSVAVSAQPVNQNCNITNSSGTIENANVTNVAVACQAQSTQTANVSGRITPASNIVIDSDLNDPQAAFSDNSTAATAQNVSNILTIQGFASKRETGRAGDRFAASADLDDIYQVSLQAGQILRLQVIDYEGFANNGVFEGDLDLYLFDAGGNLIDASLSTTEFEQIVVPDTGTYYVDVKAFSGTSKYVLQFAQGLRGSNQSSAVTNVVSRAEFVPNEALIKLSDAGVAALSANKVSPLSTLTLNHRDSSRVALASFNNTIAATASAGGVNRAMEELASLNPASHAKVNTLLRIKTLNQTPGIEFAEPNYLRFPTRVPNDQFYNLQWHYQAMNLPQAWDISIGTPATGQVVVAVVDTGVYLNHPELRNQLVSGYDFISDSDRALDGDGIDDNPDDPGDSNTLGRSSWHGTHVAGTIAAQSDNSQGVAGVSWGAKIMPLRVLGKGGGTSNDIIQAIRYAAGLSNDSGSTPAQPADIINLSLGGYGNSLAEQQLYQQVHDMGIIVVAAAGNDNTSLRSYPASYSGVISVSATDALGERAPYSNFGSAIDIAAPGGDARVDNTGEGRPDGVLSTLIDDSSGNRRGVYAFYQGTSMASPHVAGMFALMKAVHPPLDAEVVDTLLQNGQLTRDDGDPGRDDIYGYGSADALKALQAARQLAGGEEPPEPEPAVAASPSVLNLGTNTSASLELSNQGGGSPGVTAVSGDADWLSVAAADTDSRGLGRYTVSIARDGLNEGFYSGSIAFEFDTAATLEVQVSMQVGNVSSVGELSPLYVLLFDPDTETPLYQTLGVLQTDGTMNFTFESIPAGSYGIAAGSDVDNDGTICQTGETCGAYPTVTGYVAVEIGGEDVDNLEFIVDVVAGFSDASTTATGSIEQEKATQGFRRLDNDKKALGASDKMH